MKKRKDVFFKAMADEDADGDFWVRQMDLASSLKEKTNKEDQSVKQEMTEKYEKRIRGLISDTFFFSILIFSALWMVAPSPATPLSYVFGAMLGTAYSYGLGKFVQSIGGSVDDTEALQGAGVGQARFAFLVLLFIIAGKFRSQGFQDIPAITGFFTYQLASLSQGLKEIED